MFEVTGVMKDRGAVPVKVEALTSGIYITVSEGNEELQIRVEIADFMKGLISDGVMKRLGSPVSAPLYIALGLFDIVSSECRKMFLRLDRGSDNVIIDREVLQAVRVFVQRYSERDTRNYYLRQIDEVLVPEEESEA